MDPNFLRYLQGKSASFNPYGAGDKQYPDGAPNTGPTKTQEAYDLRDNMARLKRNALLKRIQKGQQYDYMSAPWLKPGTNRSA